MIMHWILLGASPLLLAMMVYGLMQGSRVKPSRRTSDSSDALSLSVDNHIHHAGDLS
jgi:hypothetical protein